MFKTKRLFNVHFQKEKEYVISVDVYGLCVLEKKTFALKSKPKVLRKNVITQNIVNPSPLKRDKNDSKLLFKILVKL